MTCTPFKRDGMTGFVCGRAPLKKHLCKCGRLATLLCDFPVGDATCDKPLCEVCAQRVGPNRDYCPGHPVQADPDAAAFADLPAVARAEEPPA